MRPFWTLAIVGAAAALVLAASSTGSGSVEPAGSLDSGYDGITRLDRGALVAISPRAAGGAEAVASRKSAKLSYFTTVNAQTVVPGGDQLYEFRCPAKRQPLTAGVLSTSAGLVISNSSRASPDPDRPTASGAWYEGVTNLTSAAVSWKPLLVCVSS